MAGDALLTALLGQSAQERLANDPFYVGGIGLSKQQIAPTNNTEAFLIPALQGLAGGAMQGLGRSNVAEAMAQSPLIDALKIDRSTLDTSDPFKVESSLSQSLLENQLKNQKNELMVDAIKNVTNPMKQNELIEAFLKDLNPEPKIDGSPLKNPDEKQETTLKKPEDTETVDPLIAALTQGKPGVKDKYNQYYEEFLNKGNPPTQASVMARELIGGENKANQGSYDSVKAAREKALAVMGLADTADAGIKLAGETGFMTPLATGYEKAARWFGSDEATSQLSGDALLNSIKPEIVKMSRTPGAVSDREMQSYIESAPSTSNTPEQNQILSARIRELGKLENEYADFLSSYRDANNGSTINADKLWNQYRQAVPLFAEDGSLNSKRVPWQTFFSDAQPETQGEGILEQPLTLNSGQVILKTLPDGSQVKVKRLPDGRYEEVE